MYIRYSAKYTDHSGVPCEGIFRAADVILHNLNEGPKFNELKLLINWFDNNMTVPDFYDNPACRANYKRYFYFKKQAKLYLDKMEQLVTLLGSEGIAVEVIECDKLPGVIIYEDEFQIALEPKEKFK